MHLALIQQLLVFAPIVGLSPPQARQHVSDDSPTLALTWLRGPEPQRSASRQNRGRRGNNVDAVPTEQLIDDRPIAYWVKQLQAGPLKSRRAAIKTLDRFQSDAIKPVAMEIATVLNSSRIDNKSPFGKELVWYHEELLAFLSRHDTHAMAALPALVRLLEDPENRSGDMKVEIVFRRSLVLAIGKIGLSKRAALAVPALQKALFENKFIDAEAPVDERHQIATASAFALQQLGDIAEPAIDDLLKAARLVKDDESMMYVSKGSVKALGQIRKASKRLVPILTAMRDDDAYSEISAELTIAIRMLKNEL